MNSEMCEVKNLYYKLLNDRDEYTYQDIKRIACSSDICAISELLISATRSGVIRDVELLLSIAKAEGLQNSINLSLIVAVENFHNSIVQLLLDNKAEVTYSNHA